MRLAAAADPDRARPRSPPSGGYDGSTPWPQPRYRRRTPTGPPAGRPAQLPGAADRVPCTTPKASRPCRGHHRGKAEDPAPARGDPAARKPDRRTFLTASYSVLLYVYLPTQVPPGPGECAGSARNKPSRELPDLYTRTARKTIVIGAPGK